jgi:hypothetical protein
LDVNSLYYWAHIPHVTPWVCTKSCVRFWSMTWPSFCV